MTIVCSCIIHIIIIGLKLLAIIAQLIVPETAHDLFIHALLVQIGFIIAYMLVCLALQYCPGLLKLKILLSCFLVALAGFLTTDSLVGVICFSLACEAAIMIGFVNGYVGTIHELKCHHYTIAVDQKDMEDFLRCFYEGSEENLLVDIPATARLYCTQLGNTLLSSCHALPTEIPLRLEYDAVRDRVAFAWTVPGRNELQLFFQDDSVAFTSTERQALLLATPPTLAKVKSQYTLVDGTAPVQQICTHDSR